MATEAHGSTRKKMATESTEEHGKIKHPRSGGRWRCSSFP